MSRIAAVLLSVSVVAAAFAGDLDPPPGPVAPTMKTLVEVEPRTLICDENTPGDAGAVFVIDASGSYMLGADVLDGSGRDGIRVEADDVTIDFNGFRVVSESDPMIPASGVEAGGVSRLTLVNGAIVGFSENGVTAADDLRLLDMRFVGNGAHGVSAGNRALIVRCEARQNGQRGIICATRARIVDCVAHENGNSGITASTDSNVSGCITTDNAVTGVFISSGLISRCTASSNGVTGISGNFWCTIEGCVSNDNQDGFVFVSNGVIRGCSATSNERSGIRITGVNNLITDCRTSLNAITAPGFAAGITVFSGVPSATLYNTIEDNVSSGDRCGMFIDSQNNVIRRNLVQDAVDLAYDVSAPNRLAPVRTGYSGAGPWDNFEF